MRYRGSLGDFELEKWNEEISRERLDTALKIGTAIRLGINLSAGLDGLLKQIEMVKYEEIIMIRYAPEVISISREVMKQKMGNLSEHFSCRVELETTSAQSVR